MSGDPKYQYGSAEQDAWHAYMDGAGTPDYVGRSDKAISRFLRMVALLFVGTFFIYAIFHK